MTLPPELSRDAHLYFGNGYRPGLKAGKYRLVLQQSVAAQGEHHYYHERDFTVSGPKYTIDPADISRVYPPDGVAGNFVGKLPYIGLNSVSLPWERQVAGAQDDAPWMALLVLSEAEFVRAGGESALQVTSAEAFENEAAQGKVPLHGLCLPQLSDERSPNPATLVQSLDLPADLVVNILPLAGELLLLTHASRLETGEPDSRKGYQAAVLANRTAQPGQNRLFLVSLEGHWNLLNRNIPEDTATIRFVVLSKWSFVSDPTANCTAERLFQTISIKGFGNDLGELAASQGAKALLESGYLPLERQVESGEADVAWLRGPLAPSRVSLANDPAALAKLPHIAAARQLGRLLALSSADFAKTWRDFFANPDTDKRDQARSIANYIDLHASAIDEERLGTTMGESPIRPGGIAQAAEWIGRLALLEHVPLHNILPSARLLPPESLRFFAVDPNWMEALFDGVLELGTRPSTNANTRQERRAALSELVYRHLYFKEKSKYFGFINPEGNAQYLKEESWSGLIFRSHLIVNWPDIEIELHFEGEGVELRRDLLARDVLFCLVRGKISGVTFRQPPQSLEFSLPHEHSSVWHKNNGVVDVERLCSIYDVKGSAQLAKRLVTTGVIQTFSWTTA